MANYYGTTSSNGADIKKGKKADIDAYVAGWCFCGEGDMEVCVTDKYFSICGYDDFNPLPVATKEDVEKNPDEYDEGEPMFDMGDGEAFLSGLAPFLETKKNGTCLVVQTCGAEKARFPLGACEYVLYPDGKVETNGFKHWD